MCFPHPLTLSLSLESRAVINSARRAALVFNDTRDETETALTLIFNYVSGSMARRNKNT
jgi:hypothetical protein